MRATVAKPPAARSPENGAADRRVNIKGIKELPTGYDAEIGAIFCEMRRASQLNKEQLAEQFETDITTLDALETGALLALPDWPETSRVVMAYTEALGLDGRPILRRMANQLAPEAVARRPSEPSEFEAPVPREPPIPKVPDAYANFEPEPNGQLGEPQLPEPYVAEPMVDVEPPRPSSLGRTLRWLVLLMALGGAAYGGFLAWQKPELVSSTIERLPEPLPGMIATAWEFLRPLGPATDPQNRKSDKLSVGTETSSN